MFSLSEVQTPAELQAFSMFRAWWDVVLEYLVAASALNILILMSRLSSVDTGGLVCVHPDKDKAFGFVESRYVNSRCCRGSAAWILIFYPYVLFFEWMLITASLVCWIKLPSVFTKLDTFYDILSKIFTVQPKSYRTSNTLRVAHQLAYDEKNEKAIDVLLNRLLYLMTERPFLRKSYLLRYAFVIFLCFVSVACAIGVLGLLKTFPSTFLCFLEHKPPTLRGYPSATDPRGIFCHLNIGPFIYFQIVVDCVLRLVMMGFSTYGFYWALRETGSVGSSRFNRRHTRFGSPSFNRNKLSKREMSANNLTSTTRLNAEFDRGNENQSSIPQDEDMLGQAKEFISGLPGYPDLIFCIQLLRKNTHDGHLMHDSVCSCIRRYVERFQVANKSNTETQNSPSTDSLQIENMKQKAIKESVVYVRWICNYLGFYEVPNSMDSGHLFECIEFIKDSLSIIDLNVTKSLREQIVDEIQSHPELYKTLIDDDPNFPDYETHCTRLRSNEIYGSHYVLLAASTLFNVRLVIIHCEPVTQLPEVYLPMRSQLIKVEDSDTNNNPNYHHNANAGQTSYGPMSSSTATTMSMQRRAHGIDQFTNPDEYNSSTDLNTRFLTYVSPHFYHATENLPINREWASIVTRRTRYANFLSYRRDVRSTAVRSVVSTHDYDPLIINQDAENLNI